MAESDRGALHVQQAMEHPFLAAWFIRSDDGVGDSLGVDRNATHLAQVPEEHFPVPVDVQSAEPLRVGRNLWDRQPCRVHRPGEPPFGRTNHIHPSSDATRRIASTYGESSACTSAGKSSNGTRDSCFSPRNVAQAAHALWTSRRVTPEPLASNNTAYRRNNESTSSSGGSAVAGTALRMRPARSDR